MSDRIVLLGTGTCQLLSHRIASAVLVELGALRVVFDFGHGVADRLAGLGLKQDQIEHVVLSHFHPDHLSDLIPFLHAASWSRVDPRRRDLHLYGPPGLKDWVEKLLGLFGSQSLVREESFCLRLHEVRETAFRIGDQEFAFCELPPAGNRGLKLRHGGVTVALTGDSSFHDQEVEFLSGVDLGVIDAGHLSDEEIVELAVRTQADRLVCSHLYREIDEDEISGKARKAGFRGRLIVGRDLTSFALGSGLAL